MTPQRQINRHPERLRPDTYWMMQMTLNRSVRKLTPVTRKRRVPGTVVALVAVFLPRLAGADAVAAWHAVDDIAATAEVYISARFDKADGSTSVRAGMLDDRMRLARCDRPLEAFLRRGTRIGARTTVGVRCAGGRPWSVYVPVEVSVLKRVWVASRPLPRGHVLEAGDLVPDQRDVSGMTGGYIEEKQSLLGQRLKTSVLAGRALTPGLIKADSVVHRGQTVTLAVTSAGLNIKMSGKALADGAINQRIRVENLNSGRIIEGIVKSRETVEVLVQ